MTQKTDVNTEKESFSFKVPFEIEINTQKLEDILCSAFEGGSNYWANYDYNVILNIDVEDIKNFTYDYQVPLYTTGSILFQEIDLETNEVIEEYNLTKHSLISGAKIMAETYPRHFKDWINEHDDGITADVFLQCCLFGKIVYG